MKQQNITHIEDSEVYIIELSNLEPFKQLQAVVNKYFPEKDEFYFSMDSSEYQELTLQAQKEINESGIPDKIAQQEIKQFSKISGT